MRSYAPNWTSDQNWVNSRFQPLDLRQLQTLTDEALQEAAHGAVAKLVHDMVNACPIMVQLPPVCQIHRNDGTIMNFDQAAVGAVFSSIGETNR